MYVIVLVYSNVHMYVHVNLCTFYIGILCMYIVFVYSNVHMCVEDLCTFYIGIWGAAVEAEKQSV